MTYLINDTVPKQDDSYNCGVYTCWNARCFILSRSNKPAFTIDDLYGSNIKSKCILKTQRIIQMLNTSDFFNYDKNHIASVRKSIYMIMNKIISTAAKPSPTNTSATPLDLTQDMIQEQNVSNSGEEKEGEGGQNQLDKDGMGNTQNIKQVSAFLDTVEMKTWCLYSEEDKLVIAQQYGYSNIYKFQEAFQILPFLNDDGSDNISFTGSINDEKKMPVESIPIDDSLIQDKDLKFQDNIAVYVNNGKKYTLDLKKSKGVDFKEYMRTCYNLSSVNERDKRGTMGEWILKDFNNHWDGDKVRLDLNPSYGS